MIRVLVNPDAAAFDAWWEAAEAAGDAGPAPFLKMLMGADVIYVTEHEAADIKAWASVRPGWNPTGPDDQQPLLFQRTDNPEIL